MSAVSQLQSIASQGAKTRRLVPLLKAAGRHLLFGAVTLVAIIFLTFLGLDMARGTPWSVAVPGALENTLLYCWNLLQGDLGMTAEYGIRRLSIPVVEVLPDILIRSFGLLVASLLIAAPLGLGLGIWSARRKSTLWPVIMLAGTVIGVSMPSFLLALLFQMAVIRMTWLAGSPVLPVGGFGWDEHLILPALVLAARPLAQITRVAYISISEALDQDYVRTATGKGLAPSDVLNVHVLRNVAVPVLTTISLSVRFSLTSLPVVEFFFGWQGLGYNLLSAISSQDDDLAVGMLLALGSFFILTNLLLDLSYRFIDPRLREAAQSAVTADRVSWRTRLQRFPGKLRRLVASLRQRWLRENPLLNRLRGRTPSQAKAGPFRAILKQREDKLESPKLAEEDRYSTLRAWGKATFGNPALIIGGLLVAGVLFTVLFGADLAPDSPYTTRGLTVVNGQLSVPPFPPDSKFKWGSDVLGRDLLSLILAGAQQTFLLASLVLVARLIIGFVLGAIAGWWSGSRLDRFLLGLVDIIAAFPTLLLAMTLILAFDIRSGILPFVIALCFVGWGEIMQFVRGEVMRIRPKLFIESAIAVGQTGNRIVLRHILPNLMPALISLAAIEMGAVLMLLGELGFIGIFIGGGIIAELEWQANYYHYSDVPEWGALLSNVRTYARSYPWMAIYPSLAFFVAVLGFNVFGEGLRRMVDALGVHLMRVLNRYTLAAVAVAAIGFVYLRGATGQVAVYQRQAEAFDAGRALMHAAVLSHPDLAGRALGSSGATIAADYIARQFEELGLQPAGSSFTYFITRSRAFESLDALPSFTFDDGQAGLIYQRDFNPFGAKGRTLGISKAPVSFVALGDVSFYERYGYRYAVTLDRLDFSGKILLLREADLWFLQNVPREGTLVIPDDPSKLQRTYTFSPYNTGWMYARARDTGQPVACPSYWISEEVANRLLGNAGKDLAEIRSISAGLETDEVFELDLDIQASMEAPGVPVDHVEVKDVIGHMPSYTSGHSLGLEDRVIVVMAPYDCPPVSLPQQSRLCANDNASGVAVMLEIIRNMKESGYQPYKTFLFIAYSAEGLEQQVLAYPPDVEKFLEAKYGFSSNLQIEAVVHLRGLGAGDGDGLVMTTDGSQRLANLFVSSAQRVDVPARPIGDRIDLSLIFDPEGRTVAKKDIPRIYIYWDGWEGVSRLPGDGIEAISPNHLKRAGRAISLGLMTIGREVTR